MSDAQALAMAQRRDYVGLFKYLGPMWLKVCMEILDDLCPRYFVPAPDEPQQRTALQAAGIFVERMEVAMLAVLHKRGRTITLQTFEDTYRDKLAKLPYLQRREVEDYWGAGPVPGLMGPAQPAPVIGAQGDWFVTALSGKSLSIVVGAGITVIDGSVEFTNANGDKLSFAIGLYGPSIGLSYTPNIGKIASAIPGAQKVMNKFPLITRVVAGNEERFADRVIWFIYMKSSMLRDIISSSPKIKWALKLLIDNRTAASGAAESWWSRAIGFVVGKGSAPLKREDFMGHCVCYALTLAAGPGNAGTYVLFFGLPAGWSPINEPMTLLDLMQLDAKSKGVAVISSASVALGLPSLSAGATVFWGEIK
jgi:hypothetical protein